MSMTEEKREKEAKNITEKLKTMWEGQPHENCEPGCRMTNVLISVVLLQGKIIGTVSFKGSGCKREGSIIIHD